MKRALPFLIPALILTIGLGPVQAVSTPVIQGQVSGLELCEQAVCGSAIFVAVFAGRVGVNPLALGVIAVAVNHDPLPGPLACAAITSGSWDLWAAGRHFHGSVTGTLFNTGQNTYVVRTALTLTSGGTGVLGFQGLLDHNVFPPTIKGLISQYPLGPCIS
jgi:hypothetical protein